MRITVTHVLELADEVKARTGRYPIENINHPGDGRTHYVMAESMISTYHGARTAAAYLLGILAGADPEGPAHWTDVMPARVREIDGEFRFGQIGRKAMAAHQAGTAYGRTLQTPATR